MTIVFRLPPSAAERVAFSYSPAMEAVLSLHVLVEPKHHPVQHEWVRAMRRVSPALKREIDVFAFAYRAYFPEFFFPPAAGIRRLQRRRLRERAAAVGDETLARQLLEDPRGVLERFLGLLESYWAEAFAREWQRIEPDLAASVSEAGRVIARRGLYALLRGLWPEVRSDPDTGRFWLDRPHDHEVDIGAGELLVLAPSVYVWPHVRVNCDPPWPLGLVFPASSIMRESRPRIPPAQLIGVLRALADDTRLRALRLIAERPRSTQELAPLVGVTEAALSKHLRTLAEAGLLERRRDGYYVLYRIVPDRVAALAPSLEAFLEQHAPGD